MEIMETESLMCSSQEDIDRNKKLLLGNKSKSISTNRLKRMKSKVDLSSYKEKDIINEDSSNIINNKEPYTSNNNNSSLTDEKHDSLIENKRTELLEADNSRKSESFYENNNNQKAFEMDVDMLISKTSNSSNHNHQNKTKTNRNSNKFIYGNYNRYYGYRNNTSQEDNRITLFDKDFFKGLDVLDIGCNIGHVSLTIASRFQPRKVVGIDIDRQLINIAKKNVVHYAVEEGETSEPVKYVKNVFFIQGNYVPDSDNISYFSPDYDIILALSITKWLHLNFGDIGIKRSFKKMFQQLRPNGRLILEFQDWSSYKRKKKLNEVISKNYASISFFPHEFISFLLSKEVGFSKYVELGTPSNQSKGFQRPVYCFFK